MSRYDVHARQCVDATRFHSTDRIQSRRLFFFKNFLVRYLRYLFEKGMFEVTVIFVLPTEIALRRATLLERDDLTVPGNLDTVSKLPSFSVYLDAIVKELFKVCATLQFYIYDKMSCYHLCYCMWLEQNSRKC